MTRSKCANNVAKHILAGGRCVIYAGLFLTGGCGLGDIVEEHERICRAQARIIVHDQVLLETYIKGANRAYLDRKAEFSETERALPEYVPGFDIKHDVETTPTRTFVFGEISKGRINITKDGKTVAQFIDSFASYKSIDGPTYFSCTGLFPSLYPIKDAIVWDITSLNKLDVSEKHLICEGLQKYELAHGLNPENDVVFVRFDRGILFNV